MKHLLLLFILSFAVVPVAAQSNEQEAKKPAGSYYNLTQLSFIIGETSDLSATTANFVPSVTTINGYRFNDHFSMGVGVGVAAYDYLVFPVFADFRVSIFKGNFTPIAAFKGGYAFADNDKELFPNRFYEMNYTNTGGWMCNPEIGFKITVNDHCEFLLTVGYYYQGLDSEVKPKTPTPYNPDKYNFSTNVNRVSFTVGFVFQ